MKDKTSVHSLNMLCKHVLLRQCATKCMDMTSIKHKHQIIPCSWYITKHSDLFFAGILSGTDFFQARMK